MHINEKGAAMGDVPLELVEQFARGNGAVFVGSGLSQGAGLPDWTDVVRELADELDGISRADDPRAIAEDYEIEYGRHRLVDKLRDRFDTSNVKPTLVHKSLVKLAVPVVFTTNYDDLFEKALRAARIPFRQVVGNVDTAFWTADRLQLVKLYGNLDLPESIIITTEDFERFASTRGALADILKVILQTRAVLFLGCNDADLDLGLILAQVREEVRQFARPLYTVQFGIPPRSARRLERRGLRVVDLGKQPDAPEQSSVLSKWLRELGRQVKKKEQEDEEEPETNEGTLLLAAEVRGLLQVMGFEILRESWEDEGPIFQARRMTTGENINRWFLCLERGVTVDDVERLQELIGTTPGSNGWIVTLFYAIDRRARGLVDADPSTTALTLANFYRQMLRYDGYLDELIEGSHEIDKYWVDLECSVGERKGTFQLVEYVDQWVRSPARNHLAVLGDFGTGKTWFCRYYAARAARQYLKDPDQNRIPILISLRGFAKVLKIEPLITDALMNPYNIDLVGGFETFMHLNRCGRLLLIFDGFDEMEQRVDHGVALRNYEEILQTVDDASKVILTSRPLFFASAEPLQKVLNPDFEILHLRLFDDEQIQEVLRKRVGDESLRYWQQIKEIPGLKNLASRPVMMQIISETLPAMGHIESIDGATLYGAYVDRLYRPYVHAWLEKAGRKRAELLDIRERVLLFIRDLAWDMFRSPATGTVPPSNFRERVENELGADALTLSLEDLFVLDRATGNFTFPHISFMEYFVADRIVKDLSTGDFVSLFSYTLTDGVMEFLLDLVRSRPDAMAGILRALLAAQAGRQIDTMTELLTRLGNGNPLRPIIVQLESIAQVTEIPQHVAAALGREEYLNEVIEQLPKDVSSRIRLFLLDLWSSPTVDPKRALKELTTVIYDDGLNARVRLQAVQVLGRRHGESEIQALIEAIGDQKIPARLREACIDSIQTSSLANLAVRQRVLDMLHQVITNDQDDVGFRRYCIVQLVEFDSREALEPLLSILGEFDHVLWDVSATFLPRTSVLWLADKIEKEIIYPNQDDRSLITQVASLRAGVAAIKSHAQSV